MSVKSKPLGEYSNNELMHELVDRGMVFMSDANYGIRLEELKGEISRRDALIEKHKAEMKVLRDLQPKTKGPFNWYTELSDAVDMLKDEVGKQNAIIERYENVIHDAGAESWIVCKDRHLSKVLGVWTLNDLYWSGDDDDECVQ